MKKLLLVILLIAGISSANTTNAQVIHFTEDFESGTFPPAGWAVSNGATSTVTDPDQEWHEVQNGNPGSCAYVSYVNSVDQHDEWITTPVLDLSSYASSDMRIEFDFRTSQYWNVTPHNAADITLEVSIDGGTTFTSVIFQEDDSLLLANSLLDMFWETYVWTRARTDISAFAGETNVVFGWHYLGMDGAVFGLDNVSIVDIEENDLEMVSNFFETGGLSYYSVPLLQIQPINFSGEVLNASLTPQTGTILTVTNGGTYSSTSSPVDLAVGQTDSSFVTASFTPANTVAIHNLTFTYTSDFTDAVPANNVAAETIVITEYIYARDRGVYEGQDGGEDAFTPGDFAFEAGNDFQIFADQQAFAIDVVIGAGTPSGTVIYGKIYEFDSIVNNFVYLDETVEYIVTSADVLNNANITLPLLTVPTLNAGSQYLVVVGCYSEFYFGKSGYSPNVTSYILYGGLGGTGSQYYTNNTPMVRLNFEPCLTSPSSITETVCDTYTAPSGAVYSSTGIYTDTILNAVSCDSVITIDLTVNYSSPSTLNQTACLSYTLNGQTYTSSGTYSQVINNLAGCDSTITLNLTIYNNQFPLAFQANPTAGTTPLNVIFDNQTPNLSNYNFTWSFGDGTVVQDNGSFVSHTYQSDGTWDVMLIAEDITTGCTDTLFNNGYIFSTGGTPCGHVATISQSGPITACLSDSIFLSCNTDPDFTYQWQLNGFPISGATDQTYYPAQSGSYMVVITDNNCPVFSSTIQVTINTFTAPTISGAGSISSCSGGSMTLSVPDDYVSYLWSSGGTDTSEVVTSSGDYTVTVTNVSGCQETSSIYSINASFATPPDVCIVGVDSITNYNKVVWEKPISTAIDSFYVYKESNQANIYQKIGGTSYSDTAVFNDLSSNPAAQAYRYKLSLVDSCGVESSLGSMHKSIHLTINQGVGTTWNLIWSHYEGFTFPSYNIYRGTNSTNMTLLTTIASNLNSYTDLTAPAGQLYYQIEVVSNYTCDPLKSNYNVSRSNVVYNAEAPSIIVQHQNSNVNVYPNPTSDQITIDIKGYNGLVNVEVYDLQGRLLETTTNTIVSLKKHAKGIYILKVSYGEITEEVRVVKQ